MIPYIEMEWKSIFECTRDGTTSAYQMNEQTNAHHNIKIKHKIFLGQVKNNRKNVTLSADAK